MEPSPASILRPGQRTLAAIVFTDVVSFSARMQADEETTLRLLQRDFGLMREIAGQHQGSVLKTTGDGLLLYFSSAVQAVACALAMQRQFAEHARKHPPEQVLVHRLGIHLGDVFVSEQDVMGDGVNIAARLQAEAEPGGICISQTVYDVVKNKLTLHVTSLGARELKNITESIPIYKLLLEAQLGPGAVNLTEPLPAKGDSRSASPTATRGPSGFVTTLAAAWKSRTFRIALGSLLIVILGMFVLAQVRQSLALRRERREIEKARAELNAELKETQALAEVDNEQMRQALDSLRPELNRLRNQFLKPYDFAGLAAWLARERNNSKAPAGMQQLQESADRMAVMKDWVVTSLQDYNAQNPLVTTELGGSEPKVLRVFAGTDRQLYFVEGGAVRPRSWAALDAQAVGGVIVGAVIDSPKLPPRDVMRGAFAFSKLYDLPQLKDELSARNPRRARR
jgi:class 3 adenylate cyclase